MTKHEAMDKLKALMKETIAKNKQGQLLPGDYKKAESLLNDNYSGLQIGKVPVSDAEKAIQQIEQILSMATPGAGAAASGGMTQEEYDKQKSAMYKKYKAGEITNYAYIQWKKKNNPANQAQNGPVSASAAKKASTSAQKTAAQKAQKTASKGMTDEQYNKIWEAIDKKKANGEITNVEMADLVKKLDEMYGNGASYTETKKAIDAAKKPKTPDEYSEAANNLLKEAQAGNITYSAMQTKMQELKNQANQNGVKISVKGGKATAEVKEQPMTTEEYKLLLNDIDTMLKDGIITLDEANDMKDALDDMKKDGNGFVDAKLGLGFITQEEAEYEKEQVKQQTAQPVKIAWTAKEHNDIYDMLYEKKEDGTITDGELSDLVEQLDKLESAGMTPKDAEKIMKDAVQFVNVNSMTPEEAVDAAKNAPKAPKKATITEEQENSLLDALQEQFDAGNIPYKEYAQLIDKLEANKGNWTEEEAKKELGLEQETDMDTSAMEQKLLNAFIHGDLTQDEVNKLTDMVNFLADSGTSKEQIEAQLDAAMNLSIDNGFTVEEAMNVAAGYKPGMQVQPIPTGHAMTEDEYDALMGQITEDGNKVLTDEDIKKIEQLAQIMQEGKMSANEAAAAIGLQPVPAASGSIGIDPGTLAAQQAEAELTDELQKVYGQAAKELRAEFDKFTAEYAAKYDKKLEDLHSGKITKAEFDAWVNGQIAHSELLQQQIDQMSETMLAANQKAIGMINGETFSVFAENANFQSYEIEKAAKLNLSFAVYDEDTVKTLIRNKPELLPRKKVDAQKDKGWNQEKIAAAITQGVLQGESIPKLAKRIATETAESNMKSMVRYARTAMTGAQNSGRMESLHRAKGMGIQCKKCWLATLDSRTRDSHQKMDGVTIDVDDKFKTPLGSEMEYPGDIKGKPGDVWNCRCTLTYEYDGFPNAPTMEDRIQYDDYYTTYTDKNGKKHRVYHRAGSSLITDMNYEEWKAVKKAGKMNDLNVAKVALAEAQKEALKAKISETKQYKDIWKDPVTLADYPAKKASIQGKRDYYEAEIQKYKDAQSYGATWATDEKIKELEKKLKALNEFEKNGKLLEKRDAALKAVQDLYDAAGFQKTAAVPNLEMMKAKAKKKAAGKAAPQMDLATAGEQKTQFAPDAWDAATKKAARRFNDKYKADRELRPELDATWGTLTDVEKYGVWEYTRNSHPMNQPLCGFNDRWGRVGTSHFVGLDKTIWGHQDNYGNRNFNDAPAMAKFGKANGHPSYHKAITECTKAIEKSRLAKGIWLVRGSDDEGLAGLWESGGTGGLTFNKVMDLLSGRYSTAEVKKALVGQTGQNHGFTSTGVATGTGFSGTVHYNIYAPAGTKGIYAEPQSYWGGTTTRKIYKKGDRSTHVSGEAEIIVQRGTRYRVTDVRGGPGGWEIDMEVVEQPDYFVNGDENTYNDGKTRQKK